MAVTIYAYVYGGHIILIYNRVSMVITDGLIPVSHQGQIQYALT